MKKKILVTGGTGYIGSHTVVALQESGFDVVVVDNLSNSSIKVLDGIERITGIKPIFEKVDITDNKQISFFFQQHKNIEAIIHFAAYKSVEESVSKPLKYYRNNLNGTINMLYAMQKYQIPYLVFSSSCTVYGEPDNLPVTEQTPVKKANSPYGNTKQICEEIIQDTILTCNTLNAISLRYFNPIGAHPSVHIGELPMNIPTNLVPLITQTAIGIKEQLHVFGDDYNTPDGTCIRDFIDIMDLAEAHVAAINRIIGNTQKQNYEIFNVGTGNGLSVFELIHAFEKITNERLNYRIVGRRPGDVEKIYADATLAKQEMNWKTKRKIENSLQTAWLWEQKVRK